MAAILFHHNGQFLCTNFRFRVSIPPRTYLIYCSIIIFNNMTELLAKGLIGFAFFFKKTDAGMRRRPDIAVASFSFLSGKLHQESFYEAVEVAVHHPANV